MKVIIYRDEIPVAYGLAVVSNSVKAIYLSIEVTQKFYSECNNIEVDFFKMQDKLGKLYMEARKKK